MTKLNDSPTPDRPVAILGAGPAGLTAAYDLVRRGIPVIVFESDSQVGGLARTMDHDGFRYDLGPHRFFTKSTEVTDIWEDLLGDEFQLRPRLTRIFWNNRFLDYPLRGPDVIRKLGPVELTRATASYLKAAATPKRGEEEDTYEEWVSRRFGKRLYKLFFESYTEKVWGVPTSEIRAEWAAQRIKTLSFFTAAKASFIGDRKQKVTSLIDRFHYPRHGSGQMWEAMADRITEAGGEIRLGEAIETLQFDGSGRVAGVLTNAGVTRVSDVISSAPLRNVVGLAGDVPSPTVQEAARGLRYRDLIAVAIVIHGTDPFPDNWIYIHDPNVLVGRIQNPRSFSEDMVGSPGHSLVVLEYFCFAGEELWNMADAELIALGGRELAQLGLVSADSIACGFATRIPKAYPMYDPDYSDRVDTIRSWLDGVGNLQQIGRNGLHRYNNQDHSMLTALRAVENLADGTHHDIWSINAESVYHEEYVEDEQPYRAAPETPAMSAPLASDD